MQRYQLPSNSNIIRQGQHCPVTRQKFTPGDSVVECDSRHVFLATSWDYVGQCPICNADNQNNSTLVDDTIVPHLTYLYNGRPQKAFLNKSNFTIGRDDKNTIALKNKLVSSTHAQLFIRDDQFFIENLGQNGLFVNDDHYIQNKKIVPLTNGSKIKIGDTVFTFVYPLASSAWKLIYRDTVNKIQQFSLNNSSIMIGRDANNDIHLPYKNISRKHVKLVKSGDGYLIEDLGSNNGTYVNNNRISPRLGHRLKRGDRIRIGKVILRYSRQNDDSSVFETIPPSPKETTTSTPLSSPVTHIEPSSISVLPIHSVQQLAVIGLVLIGLFICLITSLIGYLYNSNPITALPTETASPTIQGIVTLETPSPLPTSTPSATVIPTEVNTVTPIPSFTPAFTPTPPASVIVINEQGLNVRRGPGVAYPIITWVKKGTRLTVLAQNPDRDWLKIVLPDGREGWVSGGSRYIEWQTYHDVPITTDYPPEPTVAPTSAVNQEPDEFKLDGNSVSGKIAAGQDKWHTFFLEGDTVELFIMYTPNVNRNADNIRFFLYNIDQIPTWPPSQEPTKLKVALDEPRNSGLGILKWSGQLNPQNKYYLRIANDSDEDIEYCLSSREESDWSCQ